MIQLETIGAMRKKYRLKIENLASVGSVGTIMFFKICIYNQGVSQKSCGKTIKILQEFFLQIQKTKNI